MTHAGFGSAARPNHPQPRHRPQLHWGFTLLFAAFAVVACSPQNGKPNEVDKRKPAASNSTETNVAKLGTTVMKLDSYTLKGVRFGYFKIDSDLSKEQLIAVAQQIHEQEPDSQLILIDSPSELAQYIRYAKAISAGDNTEPLPATWADKHIIANVQKYTSGKFMLCKGYGFEEIAELQ
jgi:hypothetical protein